MDTKTFKITTTVRDEDVQSTREQLQAMVDDLKARVPEAIVSEMTTKPAPDDRLRPLRISDSRVPWLNSSGDRNNVIVLSIPLTIPTPLEACATMAQEGAAA